MIHVERKNILSLTTYIFVLSQCDRKNGQKKKNFLPYRIEQKIAKKQAMNPRFFSGGVTLEQILITDV